MTDPYPPHIDRLRTAGEVADYAAPWPDYPATYGLSAADVAPLVRMALDSALHEAPEPDAWAPLHAWRALGQLGAPEAAEPLATLVGRYPDDDWLRTEVPRALGMIGVPALPAVRAQLDDAALDSLDRATASEALREIVKRHPEARADAVAMLLGVLGREDTDPELAGFMVAGLLDLQAVEAAGAIEAAYVADRVDDSIPGDWEDAQIALGLLAERRTPRPNYARRLLGADLAMDTAVREAESRARAAHRAEGRAKAKAKRKAAARARHANRRRGR